MLSIRFARLSYEPPMVQRKAAVARRRLRENAREGIRHGSPKSEALLQAQLVLAESLQADWQFYRCMTSAKGRAEVRRSFRKRVAAFRLIHSLFAAS